MKEEPIPFRYVYRQEDEKPVVRGLNGPVLCILASIIFLGLSVIGIAGALIWSFL